MSHGQAKIPVPDVLFPQRAGTLLPRPGRVLQHSLGDWLTEFEWDCWCTWTFDERFGPTGPSPDRCLYHTRRWVEHLPGPACGYFLAVERGTGGRVHSHGLLRLPDPPTPSRKSLWAAWLDRYGRCRVLPYDPDRGAAYYIAKYITKEPLGWDVGGLDRRAPSPEGCRLSPLDHRPPTGGHS